MRSQADKINLVLLGVIKYFAIRLAFANRMFDVAPEMRFRGYGLLQAVRGLVIGPFSSQGIPGNLRFVQREGRQDVKQMQFLLILLRQ